MYQIISAFPIQLHPLPQPHNILIAFMKNSIYINFYSLGQGDGSHCYKTINLITVFTSCRHCPSLEPNEYGPHSHSVLSRNAVIFFFHLGLGNPFRLSDLDLNRWVLHVSPKFFIDTFNNICYILQMTSFYLLLPSTIQLDVDT
jgi:hypothetical protein